MNDLISRQAALDIVFDFAETPDKMYQQIRELPTIDPVKHGKWEPHPTEPDWDVCSVCGIGTHIRFHGYYNGAFWDSEESYTYCPHCGSKMNEVEQLPEPYKEEANDPEG